MLPGHVSVMLGGTLGDYIKVYKQTYTVDFCKALIEEIGKAQWKDYAYYNNEVTRMSPCHMLSLGSEKLIKDIDISQVPLKRQLDSVIPNIIGKYINIDIAEDWFNKWNNYTPFRLNKYEETGFMGIHCDHITSAFDGKQKGIPILSILGVLNDDYEGGELFICKEHIELKAGDVVVFPSNFLYPHEIKPVKFGARCSFASWFW